MVASTPREEARALFRSESSVKHRAYPAYQWVALKSSNLGDRHHLIECQDLYQFDLYFALYCPVLQVHDLDGKQFGIDQSASQLDQVVFHSLLANEEAVASVFISNSIK